VNDVHSGLSEEEPRRRVVVGLVLTGACAAALALAVSGVPREHAPLPAIARYALTVALPRWHTTEPVSEVVYGTRGFDTFGETFLLLAAVVGMGLLCRAGEPRQGFVGEAAAGRRERRAVRVGEHGHTVTEREALAAEAAEIGLRPPDRPVIPDTQRLGTPGPERAEAMTVVVRAGVRVVAPLLMVAGAYLVAWGYSPGGGFPGGAVALGVALLAYVATGYRRLRPFLRPDVVEPVELAGALAIVAIALGGLVFDGSLSANFLPLGPPETIRSGGVLQAFSVSELVEVGTGLILAVFGLLSMGHDWAEETP
jgi:multicomponent Na+:H+ antiporter subunit B